MARLEIYDGHFCESEYESAFISFLEKRDGTTCPESLSTVLHSEKCCI